MLSLHQELSNAPAKSESFCHSPFNKLLVARSTSPDVAINHRYNNAMIRNVSLARINHPPDVVAMHVQWTERTFPSFEDRKRVADAVLDCGAKGDGFDDDTGPLQTCLDKHQSVFLPKGLFRVRKTLHLQPGGTLCAGTLDVAVYQASSSFRCFCPMLA